MVARYWWRKAGKVLRAWEVWVLKVLRPSIKPWWQNRLGEFLKTCPQWCEQGLAWRVGNVQAIQVFQDKWLPKPTTFKPLLNRGLPDDVHVFDLLTLSREWDLGLIE